MTARSSKTSPNSFHWYPDDKDEYNPHDHKHLERRQVLKVADRCKSHCHNCLGYRYLCTHCGQDAETCTCMTGWQFSHCDHCSKYWG